MALAFLARPANCCSSIQLALISLPLKQFPEDLPIAGNGGAFAEPMAEHGLAMTLAAAKRLFIEHDNLKAGEFNQFARNKMLAGSVCGILGFGGIGKAQAKLMRGLGMKIHAINRSGATDEDVDWIGTPDQLEEFLAASDVVVLSLPLSQWTEKLFNAETPIANETKCDPGESGPRRNH